MDTLLLVAILVLIVVDLAEHRAYREFEARQDEVSTEAHAEAAERRISQLTDDAVLKMLNEARKKLKGDHS